MRQQLSPVQVGERYGRWLVVAVELREARGPNYSRRRSMARVACDCGSPERWVCPTRLRNGGTESCGCFRDTASAERLSRLRRKNDILPGNRYGRWTVAGEVVYRRIPTGTIPEVLCRCDCGTERVVNCARLRTETRGCGCAIRNPTAYITFEGETKSVRGWARDQRCEVTYRQLRQRLRRGESFDTARLKRPRGR